MSGLVQRLATCGTGVCSAVSCLLVVAGCCGGRSGPSLSLLGCCSGVLGMSCPLCCGARLRVSLCAAVPPVAVRCYMCVPRSLLVCLAPRCRSRLCCSQGMSCLSCLFQGRSMRTCGGCTWGLVACLLSVLFPARFVIELEGCNNCYPPYTVWGVMLLAETHCWGFDPP
jgi:hypothetical protein